MSRNKDVTRRASDAVTQGIGSQRPRVSVSLRLSCLLLTVFCLLAAGCGVRFDMQDQPRYKAYKQSDFFSDKRAMRDLPQGTIARGQLRTDKALYTGKKENADPNAPVQTTVDPASGNTLISSFPNDVDEFRVGEDRRKETRTGPACELVHEHRATLALCVFLEKAAQSALEPGRCILRGQVSERVAAQPHGRSSASNR